MRQLISGKKNGGFTLVEMSIVLLIMGLIIGSSASYYGLYQKRQSIKTTDINIDAVTAKLSEFRNINGRYPAPASLTLPRGDADYGRENTTVCTNAAKAPGTCENGICIKSNARDINGDAVPDTLRVCVGTIPFRQLNLDESQAFDGHGSRLVYAVTEDMTDDAKFKPDIGGIDVLKGLSATSALELPASAHFAVISPGPDRAGGYTADGVQIPCPAAGAAQNANCNTGAAAVFRSAQTATPGGAAQFDDTLDYFIKDPVPLWQISPDAAAKAQGDMIMKPTDSLGAKIKMSDVDETIPDKVYIDGVARAADKVVSNRICDGSGTDCFDPDDLSGKIASGAGMKCPEDDPDGAGAYMIAIEYGHPVCEDEVVSACRSGEVMTGVDPATGQIKCSVIGPPPPCADCCPSFQTTFCGRTYTVPDVGRGGVTTVYDTNGNGGAWEYWYCNPLKEWKLAQLNYTCGCTPVAETMYDSACATGYSGAGYTYRVEIVCPGSGIKFLDVSGGSAIPVSGSCSCVPGTFTQTRDCPGNTGIYTATRTHDCTGYNPVTGTGDTWSAWDESDKANCPCTAGPVYRQDPCPSGSGSIQMQGTRSCPGAVDSGWFEVSNTCGATPPCDPSQTEDSPPQACPQGYNPNPVGIIKRRNRDCSTGGWFDWYPVSNDCVAGPPQSYKWGGGTQMNFTPQPAVSGVQRGSSCTFGAPSTGCYEGSSSAAYNYSNCTCGAY